VRRLPEALHLDEAQRAALLAVARPYELAGGPAHVESIRSLPLPLSSFVGRDRGVAEVKVLLECNRLVTLTGTGGIGKTRLASPLAGEWMSKDREAGALVALVDLASLADPDLVPLAIAAQLGVKIGYELDVGVGIAPGYATLGRIGFEGRFDHAAIGPVTNLAVRLCAEARPGQILVSQRGYVGVEGLVDAEFVGDLPLKGFSRLVPTYSVLRASAGPGWPGSGATAECRGPAPGPSSD
jgi:hypothetical protein